MMQALADRSNSLVLQPHLHGQVADELLELVAARHEVRLAVHLHQHAQPAGQCAHPVVHGAYWWGPRSDDAHIDRASAGGSDQITLQPAAIVWHVLSAADRRYYKESGALGAQVDIGADGAVSGGAAGLLASGRQPLLAQKLLCSLHVTRCRSIDISQDTHTIDPLSVQVHTR